MTHASVQVTGTVDKLHIKKSFILQIFQIYKVCFGKLCLLWRLYFNLLMYLLDHIY